MNGISDEREQSPVEEMAMRFSILERLAGNNQQTSRMTIEWNSQADRITGVYVNDDQQTNVLLLFHHLSQWLETGMLPLVANQDATNRVIVYRNQVAMFLSRVLADPEFNRWTVTPTMNSPPTVVSMFLMGHDQVDLILDKLPVHDVVPVRDGGDLFECPICLENCLPTDAVVVLQCHANHLFHRGCIKMWLEHSLNRNRPIYRTPIRKYGA